MFTLFFLDHLHLALKYNQRLIRFLTAAVQEKKHCYQAKYTNLIKRWLYYQAKCKLLVMCSSCACGHHSSSSACKDRQTLVDTYAVPVSPG